LLIALFVAAALLVPAAVAWACTPSATISSQASSGPSGSSLRVKGERFVAGPVEIRWFSQREFFLGNSPGLLLGRTTGPHFSKAVRVPKALPGPYYVVARGPPDGAFGEPVYRSAPFEVTPAPPGRCSKLKGKRRAACVKKRCGKREAPSGEPASGR
jgi:hypothetical protein